MEKVRNLIIRFNDMIEDESKRGFHLGNIYQNHSISQHFIHPSRTFAYFHITNYSYTFVKPDIPFPFKDVHQYLLNTECITLTSSYPIQLLFLMWYSPNEKCEYPNGILGYSIKNYKNFIISSL